MIPKLVLRLKSNPILKLGFILKFQNFKLILDRLKLSIPSLKPPGRLASCYFE